MTFKNDFRMEIKQITKLVDHFTGLKTQYVRFSRIQWWKIYCKHLHVCLAQYFVSGLVSYKELQSDCRAEWAASQAAGNFGITQQRFFPHQLILSRKVHSDVNLISYCHVRVKQPLELIQFYTITDAWQQSLATSWIHFLYKLKYLSSTR